MGRGDGEGAAKCVKKGRGEGISLWIIMRLQVFL